MNYVRPEVAVLGDASRVIENVIPHKPASNLLDRPFGFDPAYDLDE